LHPPPPTPTLSPYTTLFRSNLRSGGIRRQPDGRVRRRLVLPGVLVDLGSDRRRHPLSSSVRKARLFGGAPFDVHGVIATHGHREIGRATSELQSRENLVCRL